MLAVLAFLNAQSYFISTELSYNERRQQLFEALALVRKIEREDLVRLFESLAMYLYHAKGEYLTTIKFLEEKTHLPDCKLIIQLLLVQAYLGSQTTTFDFAKGKTEDLFKNHQVNEGLVAKINYIFDIDEVPDPAIKEETDSVIKQFLENPKQFVYMLVLLQEVCL